MIKRHHLMDVRNGKAPSLSQYALDTLFELKDAAMTCHGTNPGCIWKLLNMGLVEIFDAPVPVHWVRSGSTRWMRLTPNGSELVSQMADAP